MMSSAFQSPGVIAKVDAMMATVALFPEAVTTVLTYALMAVTCAVKAAIVSITF